MAVREDGLSVGSASSGCLEGSVVEAALEAVRDGQCRILSFGPQSEASLYEVGLTCGGTMTVLVTPTLLQGKPKALASLARRLRAREPISLKTEFADGKLSESLQPGREGTIDWQAAVEGWRLIEPLPVAPRLFIVGAVHIGVHLAALASAAGFETLVVDPRAAFARRDRFLVPPNQLCSEWPMQAFQSLKLAPGDAVAVLTHDPKIDDQAILAALHRGVRYVGALGSRKSHAERCGRLRALGATDAELERVRAPIGLNLGATTPAAIAVSILAEIVSQTS